MAVFGALGRRSWVPDERDLRYVDATVVRELMGKAAEEHLGGSGRPEWFAEHGHDVGQVIVQFLLLEPSPRRCFRCRVVLRLGSGDTFWFPVDIFPADFLGLARVREEKVALASDMLDRAEFVPVSGERLP